MPLYVSECAEMATFHAGSERRAEWPQEPPEGECYLVAAASDSDVYLTATAGEAEQSMDDGGEADVFHLDVDSGRIFEVDWQGAWEFQSLYEPEAGLNGRLSGSAELRIGGVDYRGVTGRQVWGFSGPPDSYGAWMGEEIAVVSAPLSGFERVASGQSENDRGVWLRVVDVATGEALSGAWISQTGILLGAEVAMLDQGQAVVLSGGKTTLLES